jgi:thermostable 8-oxoguanine DNA glycosylase
MLLEKAEIEKISSKYDEKYPEVVQKEEELGKKIRKDKEIGKETIYEIVRWKFSSLPGRIKRTFNLLEEISDEIIMETTRKALSDNLSEDDKRIKELRKIRGIGISLASVILTFYDPERYCIYDIHVVRELYGKEPKYMFKNNKYYLELLQDLRELGQKTGLEVRTIEKAVFLKNIGKNSDDHNN